MATPTRQLSVRLSGPLADGGRVPLALVSEKLAALQRLLFNIGSALRGGGKRGSFKSEVLQSCELLFVRSQTGSLELVTEVAAPPALFDLGVESVDALWATMKALDARDTKSISNLYPDASRRARVLKSIVPLLPEDEADYDLALIRDGQSAALAPSLRPFITRLSTVEQITEGEFRTLTGVLFRIEVGTGQRQLGLMVNNRQIRCFYESDYEEVVRELVPGSVVEIDGLATLDERGEVHQIETVLDARSVQIVPLFWSRVIHGDRVFRLKLPVQIRVDFTDGLWVHELESLGILAYARTRTESLAAFREEFAAVWDAIAGEPDEKLTADAQALKSALLATVEREDPQ